MKKIIFIMLFAIITLYPVFAYTDSGRIGLLTVSETSNESLQRGGVADLYLSIKPGNGRIYIDSFPLSRLDTQITMRFASELSCDFLQVDCSSLDFFYTIRADSSIVGGPSAGAAATVLTVAMLDEQKINERTIMTGTINSGYLIGPVAGISQKTLAAQQYGYTKALIPRWESINETFDKNLTIKIIHISTLEEALFEFTGKNYSKYYPPLSQLPDYKNIMKKITIDLCSRYGGFKNSTIILPNVSENNESKDYFGLALKEIEKENYYSAASFCFGGNVRISRETYKNLTNTELKKEYAKVLGDISIQEQNLKDKDVSTITELETYMIVKERIDDAKEILREQDPDNISGNALAYAAERMNTVSAWSQFFKISGKTFDKNQNTLEIACKKKISEAEERINYLQIYYPGEVDRSDIKKAYDYLDSRDYALCIFTSSKAKADIDVILSALFVKKEDISQLLNEKLDAASKVISKQQQNGLFPILGYSYYEYSNSLKDNETYSALIYAEYALEMSNLDMYLGIEKQKLQKPFSVDNEQIALFVLGFSLGALFVIIIILAYARFRKDKPRKTSLAKGLPGKKR